jgi:ABC-type branched-subunit amino acid transport system ATPase component
VLLNVKDIHVYYGKSHVLRGVCLEVAKAEIVAIIGRNGAGKTTTLKSILGLVRIRRGGIFLDGVEISRMAPFRRARAGIGYVPQGMYLFRKLTVYENLKTGLKHRHDQNAMDMVFELFPILKDRRTQRAGTLSGGEQQMLTIARALLTDPQLLVVDEPSTGLMPTMVSRLVDVLRRLNGEGLSILLVEEKIPMAMELAHRIFVMEVGKIVHEGDAVSIQKGDLLVRHLGVSSDLIKSGAAVPGIDHKRVSK